MLSQGNVQVNKHAKVFARKMTFQTGKMESKDADQGIKMGMKVVSPSGVRLPALLKSERTSGREG